MPSRIDGAGHTKAFDYPVAEHWGESQRTKRSLVGFEPTSAHTYESEIQRSTTYATPFSGYIYLQRKCYVERTRILEFMS